MTLIHSAHSAWWWAFVIRPHDGFLRAEPSSAFTAQGPIHGQNGSLGAVGTGSKRSRHEGMRAQGTQLVLEISVEEPLVWDS